MSDHDTGFGRRPPPADEPPFDTALDDGPPPFQLPVRGLLIGATLGLCVFAAYVALMKQAGHKLADHWEENVTVGYPDVGRSAGADTPPDVLQIHESCRSQSAGRQLPPQITRQIAWVDTMAEGETAVHRRSAYLVCLMETQPERFCDESHRAQLVLATKEYLLLQTRVREEWQIGNHNIDFEQFDAWREAGGKGNMPMRQHAPETGGPTVQLPSEGVAPDVAEGLRTLAASGYVRLADFGGFMGYGAPSQVTAVLRDVKREKDACRA